MNTKARAITLGAVICAALTFGAPRPAATQDVDAALRDCRVLADATSRLFCYDRLVDTRAAGTVVAPSLAPSTRAPLSMPGMTTSPVTAAPATAAPTPAAPAAPAASAARPVAPAPVSPAPVATPPAATASRPRTDRFGEENLPTARRAPAGDPDQMRARVTALATDPYGDAVLTLDNGQVWKQTEGRAFKVDSGTAVTIKKGMLGAFFLTADDSSRSIKVKRVQ